MSDRDPYDVLGIKNSASDEEVRSAYHRLVKLHHPDHNRGSTDAARRFEEVQGAYARITSERKAAPRAAGAAREARVRADQPKPPPSDPRLDARLAELERELRQAQAARQKALRDAREAAAASYKRPSDEELGYVHTDDTLGKVLADARAEFSDRLSEARESQVGKRVSDLIDELAAKLTGDDRAH
jgi:curved DNA-binding protein CbpA